MNPQSLLWYTVEHIGTSRIIPNNAEYGGFLIMEIKQYEISVLNIEVSFIWRSWLENHRMQTVDM